jgi:hypothetical protein
MTLLTNDVHVSSLGFAEEFWRKESCTEPYVIGLLGTVALHPRQVSMDTFSIVAAALQIYLERERAYRKDVRWTS